MRHIPAYRLLADLYADGTHEVVVDMIVRELIRRADAGECY